MKSRLLAGLSVLAFIVLTTWNAWACSGPGAMEAIVVPLVLLVVAKKKHQ
jgi:hypothetical protein